MSPRKVRKIVTLAAGVITYGIALVAVHHFVVFYDATRFPTLAADPIDQWMFATVEAAIGTALCGVLAMGAAAYWNLP